VKTVETVLVIFFVAKNTMMNHGVNSKNNGR